MWNTIRFTLQFIGANYQHLKIISINDIKHDLVGVWILDRLNFAISEINIGFKTYDFNKIIQSMYHFWIHELCDIYLESLKNLTNVNNTDPVKIESSAILYTCVNQALKLIHPVMPFITEELWQRLTNSNESSSIMISSYPEPNDNLSSPNANKQMEIVMEIVKGIRSLKETRNSTAWIVSLDSDSTKITNTYNNVIQNLALTKVILLTESSQFASLKVTPTNNMKENYFSKVINENVTIYVQSS